MKRLILIMLTAVATLAFTACGDDNDEPVTPTTAQKTIIFYMPWTASATSSTGSLYSYFLTNISDVETAIRQQGGLSNNRLLVFIAPSATYSALLEIKYEHNACVRDTLRRYTSLDVTTPSGIATVLGDVKSLAPARKYDMIIGSHGNGWIPRNVSDYYRTRAFGGSTTQYKTDISTLASGISAANMHMQFICFDDCYMAGVEVAYDLKEVTDYLIASTSEVMADGMPYREVWRYMAQDTPDYANICQAFYNHYSSSSYPYGALSVIICPLMDDMAQIMKQINASYTFDEGKLDSVQKLDGFGQTTFFDLADYVDKLCGGQTPATFTACLNDLVPYSCHTQRIYTSLDDFNGGFNYIDVNTFSGITISDPTQNTYLVDYKTQTAWWQATH